MTNITIKKEAETKVGATKSFNWNFFSYYFSVVVIGVLFSFFLPAKIHTSILLYSLFLMVDILIVLAFLSLFNISDYDEPNTRSYAFYWRFFFPFFLFSMTSLVTRSFVYRNDESRIAIDPQNMIEEVFQTGSIYFIFTGILIILVILLVIGLNDTFSLFKKRWSSWKTKEIHKEMIIGWISLLLVFAYFSEIIMSVFFDKGVFFDYYLPNNQDWFQVVIYLTIVLVPMAIVVIFKKLFYTLPNKLEEEY